MATLSRSTWIKLYKDLQKAAKQFPQYNYRHFARERIRDYFETNRNLTTEEDLQNFYSEGKRNLNIIQRQVAISKLYPNQKLVIETDN